MKLPASFAPRLLAPLTLLALFAVGGCGDDSSPGKDLQVANVADSFQFQVTDTKNYSHTYAYTWANSGTAATINQASSITGGDATLVLKDSAGATVYSRSLKQNGTFTTATGAAGNWTIQVLASKVSGTLNFRAQKL
ncbi:MAG TPA: hypothetical protein VFS09_02315 [Candidatus Eisenbacteria bacterium]|nr:hypothetical protein [Candidatus Eisenbacteria bacterium]